jgi:NADH:ubiquinone oxidoreductase subunit 4 (subunit M)
MDFIQDNLLNLIIFFPAAAALLIFLLPEDEKNLIRRMSFVLSLVPIALVLLMWFNYDRVAADIQFEVLPSGSRQLAASLPHGHRRHQPAALLADRHFDPAGDSGLL